MTVADLCEPLDVMNKTNQGKQTLLELTGALVHTKDLFRDAATTRVIMEMLRYRQLHNHTGTRRPKNEVVFAGLLLESALK